MADFERISVALPAQMAELVRKAVESGQYASTSEIVREALRLWEEHEFIRQRRIEEIRKAWDEGMASGVAGPFDIEALLEEAKAEAAGDDMPAAANG